MKPWPSDAVMIVAAFAGEENREKMEGPRPAACRDCGRPLVADTFKPDAYRLAVLTDARKRGYYLAGAECEVMLALVKEGLMKEGNLHGERSRYFHLTEAGWEHLKAAGWVAA